jgi:hypothetical protein
LYHSTRGGALRLRWRPRAVAALAAGAANALHAVNVELGSIIASCYRCPLDLIPYLLTYLVPAIPFLLANY